jgi:hypothetical protein
MTEASIGRLRRISGVSWIVAGAGIVALVAGLLADRTQFFHAYLFGWFFWFGLSAGSLGILLLHHLLGGAWGAITRRFFEAAVALLPLTALLFIPLLFGLRENYPWARLEEVAADPKLVHKLPWLNATFFFVRSAIYFVVWIALGTVLTRASRKQDAEPAPRPLARLELLSAPALIGYFLTLTFASIDWLMSLEPHWSSTIYGLVGIAGQAAGSMAFVIVLAAAMTRTDPQVASAYSAKRFQDLGTLLFTFVFFWAYLEYSQLIVIWFGNLKHEIPWYLHRIDGAWSVVTLALFVLHFVVPFTLLLFRRLKQNKTSLARVAWLVLAAHLIDTYWLIVPDFQRGGVEFHWLDIAAVVAVGGIWLGAFAHRLRQHELLPQREPELSGAPQVAIAGAAGGSR